MATVPVRELRNNTRAVLQRVQSGEALTVTVDGIPVATINPIDKRPQSMTREWVIEHVIPNRADPGLADELREMLPDTTDDIPDPWA